VSTLELFFDLVFVFTITQVALIVEHHSGWSAAAQAFVELTVIFWMYAGFAWLTNTLGARTARQRVVLLLGMAAFVIVSLAVPRAFDTDGIAFGWAYLLLNAVHLAGFLIGGVPSAAKAMRQIGSANLLAAGLIIVAGYAGGPWHWPLWLAAVVAQWVPAMFRNQTAAFAINVAHFTERHGLMIIIVLGESLVSVALAAEAFERLDPGRRGPVALLGYDLPHVFMLAGVVSVAAGSRLSLPDLASATDLAAAALIAGGVAVYLLALAWFRAALRIGNPLPRVAAGVAVLALVPIGTSLGAGQQLLATAALVTLLLVTERLLAGRHPNARGGDSPADRAG